MTDDLVKRLRSLGSAGPGRISFLASEDAMKAADRIEALEAALRDVVDRLVAAFPAMEQYKPIQNARAALAGEKKK